MLDWNTLKPVLQYSREFMFEEKSTHLILPKSWIRLGKGIRIQCVPVLLNLLPSCTWSAYSIQFCSLPPCSTPCQRCYLWEVQGWHCPGAVCKAFPQPYCWWWRCFSPLAPFLGLPSPAGFCRSVSKTGPRTTAEYFMELLLQPMLVEHMFCQHFL